MCDPLTIAGIALTGLGTGAQYAAQAKVNAARDDAMAQAQYKQAGLEQQAQQVNSQSQNRFIDPAQQQADKATQLSQFYQSQNQNNVKPLDPNQALPTSSSNVTNSAIQQKQGQVQSFANQQADALGKMQGFGGMMGDLNRAQARDAQTLGQVHDFEQGNSNVLGYQLDAANHAADGLSAIGNLASGLGGIGITAGISKVNPFASLFGSTPSTGVTNTISSTPQPYGGGSIYRAYGG